PAFAAAAALLGRELTVPEVAQSVILTRMPGRASPMPSAERLDGFAAISPNRVVHRSLQAVGCIVSELVPRDRGGCTFAAEVGAPRAPECAIIHTELTGRPGLGVEMPFIISSATRSEQRDQASTTLLYFSPEVIRPSWYCCSYSLTSFWVWVTSRSLVAGMTR